MFSPFHGRALAILYDETGELVSIVEVENFLTETGEALIANRLTSGSAAAFSHMAIGTGSGRTRVSTTLATELTRVALDSNTQGAGANDNDAIMVATFPTGTSGSIIEGAVFNNVSAGTMLNYFTFSPPVVKGTSQTLVLTITLTCGYS